MRESTYSQLRAMGRIPYQNLPREEQWRWHAARSALQTAFDRQQRVWAGISRETLSNGQHHE